MKVIPETPTAHCIKYIRSFLLLNGESCLLFPSTGNHSYDLCLIKFAKPVHSYFLSYMYTNIVKTY